MNPIDDDLIDDIALTDSDKSDEYYTADLVRGESDTLFDDPENNNTDLGGVIAREDVMDADNDGSIAGLPGHPGIDEDTG
ncbi:MAG: hypothetical protein ACEQSA_06030 [Weeksellaceae bacterium]